MAGDPIQTQPQTRQSESSAFQEWYAVTGDGASALRMMPGLTVGELDSGALTLNDPDVGNQWVEFVLAENGEPWATIVTRDKSLRVAGTTCLRHPLRAGATVRLPNNTLHISRDMRMPRLAGAVVEVVHREIPERLQDLVGPGLEEALAAVREPRPGMPAAEVPEPSDPTEPAEAEARSGPAPRARDDWPDDTLTIAEPRRTQRQPARRRRPVAVMAGALALGAVALAGVLAVLVSMDEGGTARLASFDQAALDTPPLSSPAATPAPVESSGDAPMLPADPAAVAGRRFDVQAPRPASSQPGPSATTPTDAAADGELTGPPAPARSGGAETADSRSAPAADAIPTSEPAAATDQEPEQVATLPRAEPELVAPVVAPPPERRPVPSAARASEQTADATEAVTRPETADIQPDAAIVAERQAIDSGPDPAVVAELEEIGLMAQAVATDLTRQRDLLAADLALAQGRLTTPAEANAYTLYNRVLALDPGSPEATSGLQSVRQELINRALAQLAGDNLDDALRTLQAAEDAGANPLLISDLRAEVDYRRSETPINSSR